jgi:glycosyltransferase involved in cell wall biosynthesis
LHAGFAKAQGDVIITMDADLQDSPEEIRTIQYDYLRILI